MLAGRKLLLADDSITIQKVVDLTFADEDVSVVCVSNGREAIEWLQEFTPDIVLADVLMPEVNGYEVCEYIKRNDRLKHIPVMLLVGSFEPFDEEEARRVGANETLTKPFQSIRRLIDRVGQMVGGRPPEEQIPTAELPKPDEIQEQDEQLTSAELEITTADTKPLPPDLQHVGEAAAKASQKTQGEIHLEAQPEVAAETKEEMLASEASVDAVMESNVYEPATEVPQRYEGAGEGLLDLGEYAHERSALDDEFVLDLDLEEMPEPSPAEPAFLASSFRSRDNYRSSGRTLPRLASEASYSTTVTAEPPVAKTDPMATTLAFERIADEPVDEPVATPQVVVSQAPAVASPSAPENAPQQLSPEMIDAIARRVVEQLSEKVVQEIAWEVVPQLAELLIKRQLEDKSLS